MTASTDIPDISSAGRATPPDRSEKDWPILLGAAAVAIVATSSAYVAMTGFAHDILGIGIGQAYAFAGVFELTMIVLALLARNRARRNRPARTLLGLTWVMAAASGCFSALHELLALGHGPVAAAFRLSVPLLAALLWHYVLTDERENATERSWTAMREDVVMHMAFDRSERWWRARVKAAKSGRRSDARAAERANRARLRSARRARRVVPPERMPARIDLWTASAAKWNLGDRAVGEGVLAETAHTDSVVAELEAVTRDEIAITTAVTRAAAQALTQPTQLRDAAGATLAQRAAQLAQPQNGSSRNSDAARATDGDIAQLAQPAQPVAQAVAQRDAVASRNSRATGAAVAQPAQPAAQDLMADLSRNPDSPVSSAQTAPSRNDDAAATQPSRNPRAAHAEGSEADATAVGRHAAIAQPAQLTQPAAQPVAQRDAAASRNSEATFAQPAQPTQPVQPAAQREDEMAQLRGAAVTQPDDAGSSSSVVNDGRGRVRDAVDVLEVDLRRRAGESWQAIARAMGFSRDTVRRAHQAWKDDAPVTPANGIRLVAVDGKR